MQGDRSTGRPPCSMWPEVICSRKTFWWLLFLCWLAGLAYILIAWFLRTPSIVEKQAVPYTNANSKFGWSNHLQGQYGELLSQLGFDRRARLYPQPHHGSGDQLPVIVLTINKGQTQDFFEFLGSLRIFYPEKKLVVYDLGVGKRDLELIRNTCQCLVRTPRWSSYPRHIHHLHSKAYLPILIQETLMQFGAVFWCNVHMRFYSSQGKQVFQQAQQFGLVAWSIQPYPTSSLTYPAMFRYFHANPEDYYFHHMVEPDAAIYFNFNTIHSNLMLPWVQCALDTDCLSPPGAVTKGCNFNRRPRYSYSGCHAGALAAFNVVLGHMFGDDQLYLSNQTFFKVKDTGRDQTKLSPWQQWVFKDWLPPGYNR